MFRLLISISILSITAALAHHDNEQEYFQANDRQLKEQWAAKYGEQIDLTFSGPLSYAHLPYTKCLDDTTAANAFDIAILGLPFDTGVTHRPGARFGPYAIRSGSRRIRGHRSYTPQWGVDPFSLELKSIDCGDVPVSPFDNKLAVDQMEVAYSTLLSRPVANTSSEWAEKTRKLALDSSPHPRLISLGGDHTIVLPILRALHKVYGPVTVIHFDAHLDTWPGYPGAVTEQSLVTHGTFFFIAAQEGLMNANCVHAGIRCKMVGEGDIDNDKAVGFQIVSTDDIDDLGIPEIVRRIRSRVGDSPIYLSLDIDVIDPGNAPATGTPEPGGWTTREVKRILRGLAGLNIIGADIVEVSPSYDTAAELTGLAAADIVHDFLSMMQLDAPPSEPKTRHAWKTSGGLGAVTMGYERAKVKVKEEL